MMTVEHTPIHNWWDGLVIIDEIKEYSDDRGSLTELWRFDDEKMTQFGGESGYEAGITFPKMSYWSTTKPFVIRGPHSHIRQTDWFITWKGTMVYQLFNPKTREMRHYITNPNKITRVKVAPPIVHSYRNLECRDILTGNFPTELFMGQDKKGYNEDMKIDEVRHENVVQPSKNIWVLGANGRLGKALVDRLYADMDYHTYNVIPIVEKFTNSKEGMEKLHLVLKTALHSRLSDHDIVVNCIGKTNVQNESADFTFSNFLLPKFIAEFCINHRIYYTHFSTDYVYQEGETTPYTESKKMYEKWLANADEEFKAKKIDDVYKYAKIIRVANLFSQDKNDTHNVVNKIHHAILMGKLTAFPNTYIMPTDVADLAKFLSENYIHKFNDFDTTLNISGEAMTIDDFAKFIWFGEDQRCHHRTDEQKTFNNVEAFLQAKSYKKLDCSKSILKKVNQIRGTE